MKIPERDNLGTGVLVLFLITIVMVAMTSCTSGNNPTPSPASAPTPDIIATVTEAVREVMSTPEPTHDIPATVKAVIQTVENQVQATVAAIPTATPLPTYTPDLHSLSDQYSHPNADRHAGANPHAYSHTHAAPILTPTPTPTPTVVPTPTPNLAQVEIERKALTELYHTAGGRHWKNNWSWTSDRPLDSWTGVTTDRHGSVTKLDLSGNGLEGTIPSSLGNLSNLVVDQCWIDG